jgi:hypothetical protein
VRRSARKPENFAGAAANAAAGAALLLTDLRVALLLLNNGRYRVMRRYLGVTPDQANLLSLVLVLMVAESVSGTAGRVRAAAPQASIPGVALGATVTSEVFFRLLGGISGRDTQVAGALVLIVLVARELRSSGRGTIDAIRAWSRRRLLAFNVRYGS